MPSAHKRHASWTPARITAFAEKIGPATAALTQAIMIDRPHPEQGFRTCLGIPALEKVYGQARLEAACQRGELIKARSVGSIRSIHKTGLDRAFLDPAPEPDPSRRPSDVALGHTVVQGPKRDVDRRLVASLGSSLSRTPLTHFAM